MSLNVEVLEASVEGIRMPYCRFGGGSRTMVILPGLAPTRVSDSAQLVAESFSTFMDNFTVYLFDIQEDVPEGATVPQLAEDTYIVMRSLGLSDVSLFGASLGGMLSICIDAAHPGFVAKMVLASTLCRADDDFSRSIERWMSVARVGDGMKLMAVIASDVYSEATLRNLGEDFYLVGNSLTKRDLARFANTAWATASVNVYDQAQRTSAEAFVAWSRGDRIMGHNAFAELICSVKAGEVEVYSDAYGHAVYDEAPEFKEHMRRFFLRA